MDPYLEWHWGEVHHSFVTYARDQMQLLLPNALVARLDERVFVESAPLHRSIVPDVRILERRRGKGNGTRTSGTVAVAEPLVIELEEPITEGFIEIRDRESGNRLVTVVEVLTQVTEFGEKKRYFRAGLRRKSFATNTRFGKPACSEDLPPCQVASRFAIVALSPWRKG
jgi:uncharacterized protein DUF4058